MSDTSSEQRTLNNSTSPQQLDTLSSFNDSSARENEEINDDDDDPLSVKQLSLNFEYLMYKINDRVKTLSEQTEEVILNQKVRYESDVDRINRDLERINGLTSKYKEIMGEFTKLEQLSYIVGDFNSRLTDIEKSIKSI